MLERAAPPIKLGQKTILQLRSLLLENDPCLFGYGFLFAKGACDIAQWNGLRHRAELPQRPFSVSESVGVGASSHNRVFAGHWRYRGVLRVVRKLEHHRLVRQSSLSKSPGGTEENQNEHYGFHSVPPIPQRGRSKTPAKLRALAMNSLGIIPKIQRNTLHIQETTKLPRAPPRVAQTCLASVCFPLIDSGRQL